jgi:hypothetical protein
MKTGRCCLNVARGLATIALVFVAAACSGATPAPTSAPSSTPTPTAMPLTSQTLVVPELATYQAGDPFRIPVTMTVPAGWQGNIGGPYAVFLSKPSGSANGGADIAFSLSQTLYADPCTSGADLAPQPGPTVEDLAAALASLPGLAATTPTAATVSGFSGTQLTLTAPDGSGACMGSPDGYQVWRLPLGGILAMTPGEQMALWILDVNGQRLVVSSETRSATTAQEKAEAQAILDSIHIEGAR